MGDALIDNVLAHFSQTMNVGFAGPEIASLNGVVEQTVNAVAVVLIILRRVDPTLSGDAVRSTGTVLITEAAHVVAEFSKSGRSGSTGQAGADDNDLVLALVSGVDEFEVEFVLGPEGIFASSFMT